MAMEIQDFPGFVRALRKKLNLTQEQLGERVEVSFATVNRWEAGSAKPQRRPLANLIALAQAAGVEPDPQPSAVAHKTMTDKPTAEWTWDDLLSFACWEIITGLTKGEALRSIMYRVLTIATQWKPPQPPKTSTASAAEKKKHG